MELDVNKLEEILEVLREQGATQFSCPAFSVTLGAAPVQPEATDWKQEAKEAAVALKKPVARGLYGHSKLWPDGEPASFPGSVK